MLRFWLPLVFISSGERIDQREIARARAKAAKDMKSLLAGYGFYENRVPGSNRIGADLNCADKFLNGNFQFQNLEQ